LKNSQSKKTQVKFGDRKCLSEPDKSFVGHPEAIRFLRILARRVFQQPQAESLIGQAQPNDITPTKPQTGQKQDHGLISQSGFVDRTGSDDAVYIF
jgi:hypothetical protein